MYAISQSTATLLLLVPSFEILPKIGDSQHGKLEAAGGHDARRLTEDAPDVQDVRVLGT